MEKVAEVHRIILYQLSQTEQALAKLVKRSDENMALAMNAIGTVAAKLSAVVSQLDYVEKELQHIKKSSVADKTKTPQKEVSNSIPASEWPPSIRHLHPDARAKSNDPDDRIFNLIEEMINLSIDGSSDEKKFVEKDAVIVRASEWNELKKAVEDAKKRKKVNIAEVQLGDGVEFKDRPGTYIVTDIKYHGKENSGEFPAALLKVEVNLQKYVEDKHFPGWIG